MTAQANDIQYWVAFNRVPGIGRARYSLLEKHFGRLENAWTATPAELRAAGLDDKTVAAIVAQRPKISPEAELEHLARHLAHQTIKEQGLAPIREAPKTRTSVEQSNTAPGPVLS